MTGIRGILANNLQEYRRKCGISQAKPAEKAGISTQYLAMIELSRQFPTPEVPARCRPGTSGNDRFCSSVLS
jgi:transcriptional regulator with XRE-family HTH domain